MSSCRNIGAKLVTPGKNVITHRFIICFRHMSASHFRDRSDKQHIWRGYPEIEVFFSVFLQYRGEETVTFPELFL